MRKLMLAAAAASLLVGCAEARTSSDGAQDAPGEPLVSGAQGYLEDFGVSCKLSVEETPYGVSVRMSLYNSGAEGVHFLKRATAWDPWTHVFKVQGKVYEAKYVGIRAHRNKPTDDDFVLLGAGQELAVAYTISENHRVYAEGAYEIAMRNPLLTVRVGGQELQLQHGCGTAQARLAPDWAGDIGVSTAALTYHSTCSAGQQATVELMRPIVRSMLNSYAEHINSGDGMYHTWFGAWNSGRASTVTGVFNAIDADWDVWEIRCNTGICTDPDPPNAWVTTGNVVNLCTGWFGLDSIAYEAWSNKAGTLVHEISHLEGSTDDESDPSCTDNGDDSCYGAPDARALAVANPGEAVTSAENYEHFSSNYYVTYVIASQPL